MKLFTSLFMFLFLALSLYGIDISGNQSGVWTPENNPYNVIGDITVPTNDSLVINAGVEINFAGNFSINALGNIVAEGTFDDSIFFTSNSNWNEIRLENENRESRFRYCHFTNADNAISSINSPLKVSKSFFTDNTKAVNIFGVGYDNPANVLVTNTIIKRCQQNGVFIVENSNATIDSCDISCCALNNDPHGAIQVSNQSSDGECNPTISNNHIHDNIWQGITAFDVIGVGNIFLYCYGNVIERNLTGIYLLYSSGRFDMNTIRDNFVLGNPNSGAGVMISGFINYDNMMAVFTNNIVTGNFVGFYFTNNGFANLGCLDNYCIDDDGENHIYNNVDESGSTYSIYNTSSSIILAENNIWDSTDFDVIAQTIIDGNDNSAYGIVDFDPIYDGTNNDENVIAQNNNIKVYPNPYFIGKEKSALKIEFEDIAVDNFEIYNLKGQLVKRYHSDNNKININNFKSGIYFIRIDKEKSILKKFVVVK